MQVSDIEGAYEILCSSLDEIFVKEVFFLFITGWPSGQLVAVNEFGDIAGFLSGARLTTDKSTISLFAVDPRYRKKGVGRRLMEEFRIRSMMDGRHNIQLELRDSNKIAAEFYKKMGFVPIEYLENFYNDGGNAVRMICSVYRS
ncbi:ribosomal-protein-alanine N-acetyltransferase [Candidatus Methanoplasma termitum]|uniref:Ribosomal-protein-alanine N-acetyltransferase n=2 Tax=Candidatus Methanoplasma termitum TaxID=1577791 RepID=A0A0A7LEB1_9ARCH|nr:ribosomal-protein-alanine N-acetyltransferase [Candidatus Methanoplasma termitum]